MSLLRAIGAVGNQRGFESYICQANQCVSVVGVHIYICVSLCQGIFSTKDTNTGTRAQFQIRCLQLEYARSCLADGSDWPSRGFCNSPCSTSDNQLRKWQTSCARKSVVFRLKIGIWLSFERFVTCNVDTNILDIHGGSRSSIKTNARFRDRLRTDLRVEKNLDFLDSWAVVKLLSSDRKLAFTSMSGSDWHTSKQKV